MSGRSARFFRLLFCHGLGSPKSDAQEIQKWAGHHQNVSFKQIAYRNYGQNDRVWDIDEWELDMTRELTEFNAEETIVVSNSASAQALLRALVRLESSSLQRLAGLLIFSPAIGMELENYIRRVFPNQKKQLYAGEYVNHPCTNPAVRIRVDLQCLMEYGNNCILRRNCSLPSLECPVRIVHGLYDKLVPYNNTLKLLERFQVEDKELYLINSGHIITDPMAITYALDSLWAAMLRKDQEIFNDQRGLQEKIQSA